MKNWVTFLLIFINCSTNLFGFESGTKVIQDIDELSYSQSKKLFLEFSYDNYFNDLNEAEIVTKHFELLAKNENDVVFLAQIYRKYLILYRLLNNEELALKYGFKAIKIFENHKVFGELASLYGDIGFALKHKNLNDGLKYMRIGMYFADISKDSLVESTIYDNYGVLQLIHKNVDSAIYFHHKSLNIRKLLKDSIGIGYNWSHLAMAFMDKSDYIKSKKYIDSSFQIRRSLIDHYGQADCYLYYGDLNVKKRDFKKAVKFFYKADSIGQKREYNLIRKYSFEQRAICFEALNQPDSSLYFYKLFILFKDSALNISSEKTINSLRLQFETEKKDRVIAESKVVESDQKLLILQGKKKLYLSIIIGGIVIILFFLGFVLYRSKQKSITHHLVLSEKEKGLNAVIHSQEEERRRIAKDLHDGVAQQIAAVKLNFEHVKKNFEGQNLNLREYDQSLDRLEQANIDVRRISHQMMPVALEEFGLISALEDMLMNSLHFSEIQYEYQLLGVQKEDRFEDKIEITIYRVAQELVNNIIKHSKASSLILQLRKTKQFIILHIEDDGIGINSSSGKAGIGMYNMKSRTENVHGEINFESAEKGTSVDLRIPINP